jgi:hypothetical protein
MGLKDRDYSKSTAGYSGHPPACTCVNCSRRRTSRPSKLVKIIVVIVILSIVLISCLLVLDQLITPPT